MNNYQYMSIITTEEILYYSKIIRILKCVGHCRGVDKSFTLFLGIVRLYTRVTYVKVFRHLSKWGGGGGIH